LKSILLQAQQSPQLLLPLSLHVDSFDFDIFTINYCCSFVFIPGEATIPLRRINAVSYETKYAAKDDHLRRRPIAPGILRGNPAPQH